MQKCVNVDFFLKKKCREENPENGKFGKNIKTFSNKNRKNLKYFIIKEKI